MGAYVQLLEYNCIEGMVLLSELSRRRIRSINKLIKVRGAGGMGGSINMSIELRWCRSAATRSSWSFAWTRTRGAAGG